MAGRSVLKLKLNQKDVERGVSIQIRAKGHAKKELQLAPPRTSPAVIERLRKHMTPAIDKDVHQKKGRRGQANKWRPMKSKLMLAIAKRNENESALKMAMKANEKSVSVRGLLRAKRSVPLDDMDSESYIDEMQQFIEEDENDKASDMENTSNNEENMDLYEQEPAQMMQSDNPRDYHEYAFDNAENDQFETDELLQRYYGRAPSRQSAYTDYGSFTDLMNVAAESQRENRYVKRLYYGDRDGEGAQPEEEDEELEDVYEDYEYEY